MKSRVSFLFSLLVLAGCQNNPSVIQPTIKPLMEAVYASGFVVSAGEYQVFAQVDGYLAAKLVSEGDQVKKGDPLFIIESGQQSARFRIAKENYELAARNSQENSPVLLQLQAGVESSRTKMLFDSTNAIRYTNLWKQNATTKAEYDRFNLLYENSRNEYRLQKSRYQQTLDQLQLELQNALNQLQIASDESGRYTLRSEVTGKVFQTFKDKGELVRRSENLAVVGSGDEFYLQLQVDELDVQRVKAGQSVLVKIDAYPQKIFQATVDKIYPMVNIQQQSIRVDASLQEPLPGGFSGLALEANIIIRQKEKALVVPKTALLPGDSLLIHTNDGEQKIKITRGMETLDEVEIIAGLDSAGVMIVVR